MKKSRRVILSFDVDGERAFNEYDKVERDIYLESGVPEITGFLKKNRLDATFFTVGKNIQDFPDIHDLLRDFEIGNHTFSHPRSLTEMKLEEKEAEIRKGHDTIREFYGTIPKMFRAPDYSIDSDMIRILKDLEYSGDSSIIRVLLPFRYFINYLKQRKLAIDEFEIPLTSFIIPFNGTSIISFGITYAKMVFNILSRFSQTVVINFHPRDFINTDISETGFMNRGRALDTSISFLEYLRSTSEVLSFRQFFNEKNNN